MLKSIRILLVMGVIGVGMLGETHVWGQVDCPAWAQKRMGEIIQQYMQELVINPSPFSKLQEALDKLYELPEGCRQSNGLPNRVRPNTSSEIDWPRNFYMGPGGELYGPGVGCDYSGCYAD